MGFRANTQLRENIKHLLRARDEKQQTLAFAVSIDPSTLSKFLQGERELQFSHLDAIADFFGIAVYQLFQPGIAPHTERRILDRRSGQDRRLSHITRNLRVLADKIDAAHPRRRRQDEADKPAKKRA